MQYIFLLKIVNYIYPQFMKFSESICQNICRLIVALLKVYLRNPSFFLILKYLDYFFMLFIYFVHYFEFYISTAHNSLFCLFVCLFFSFLYFYCHIMHLLAIILHSVNPIPTLIPIQGIQLTALESEQLTCQLFYFFCFKDAITVMCKPKENKSMKCPLIQMFYICRKIVLVRRLIVFLV